MLVELPKLFRPRYAAMAWPNPVLRLDVLEAVVHLVLDPPIVALLNEKTYELVEVDRKRSSDPLANHKMSLFAIHRVIDVPKKLRFPGRVRTDNNN